MEQAPQSSLPSTPPAALNLSMPSSSAATTREHRIDCTINEVISSSNSKTMGQMRQHTMISNTIEQVLTRTGVGQQQYALPMQRSHHGFNDLPENILENVSPAASTEQSASSTTSTAPASPLLLTTNHNEQPPGTVFEMKPEPSSGKLPAAFELLHTSNAIFLSSSALPVTAPLSLKIETAPIRSADVAGSTADLANKIITQIFPSSSARSVPEETLQAYAIRPGLSHALTSANLHYHNNMHSLKPASADRLVTVTVSTPSHSANVVPNGASTSSEAAGRTSRKSSAGGASGLSDAVDDDIYIDTRDLCHRIAYELKQYSIPQAVFADRVLGRSQGTLSDLLRNPKPWNKLKSGRDTFRRMYDWLQQPVAQRLGSLDLPHDHNHNVNNNNNAEGDGAESVQSAMSVQSPQTSDAESTDALQQHKRRSSDATSDADTNELLPCGHIKRQRLVFSDIQKRTLQAIFKETQRPSREMQQTIAEQLKLDLSTVANFFMNARRRSRCGLVHVFDTPTPHQQVRPITPPPEQQVVPQQQAAKPPRPSSIVDVGNQQHRRQLIALTVKQVAERPPVFAAANDASPSATAVVDQHSRKDSMVAAPTRVRHNDRLMPVMALDSQLIKSNNNTV